jgi:tetratricopeptide (TPR) repeat protein
MTEDKEKNLLEKIASCLVKGDLDACIGEAIATAKELGITPQRLLELSVIQEQAGQYQLEYILALAAADGLAEKAPAYYNAGVASFHLDNSEIAEKQFRLAIKFNPELAAAYHNLGVLLNELGRKYEAEELFRLAIKFDPKLAAAYSKLGVLLEDLGRSKDESEKQFRLAIEADPNYAGAYYNLGNLLIKLGRKDEAEVQFRLAIDLDPKLAAAYSNLGVLLDDLGRSKDESEKQFRLAINADPNYAAAHNNYANLLRKERRFSEAEREVRIALDLNPQNPYFLGTLGDILADEDWLDEAEREYKRALEHSDKMGDSVESEIHNNLGSVYAQKKLYHNARNEFAKAIKDDPRNVKAIRNLRVVGRIEPPSEITRDQKLISSLLVLPLLLSFYLFWIAKLSETSFTALFMFFIATILFVLLYRSMVKFSAGLKGVEFEMSTEHRLSPAQSSEQITKIER